MNKRTILGLLLAANLYGQMASAYEVVISESRLQNISAAELSILINQGAVRINADNVVLNLLTLDSMLKDPFQTQALAKEAQKTTARFVPYGHSDNALVIDHEHLAKALSVRFVPYGNT